MRLIYSPKTDTVVWQGALAGRLALAVPGAKSISPDVTIAPCTIEAQGIAAGVGAPAYSPILVRYDWPRSLRIKQPFRHQKEMAAFLTLHYRAHNLAEIGTGKTLGCLWAADFLMREGKINKVLVIAPLSTLHAVWRDHIGEHFAGLRSCAVLSGTSRQRLMMLDADVDYYIINSEGLSIDSVRAALVARTDIDLIIIDESHRYRNHRTERYKALKNFIGDRAVWLNTGTPTPNAPTDAWAQQALINKPQMGFRAFSELTMIKVSNFKFKPRKSAEETVVAHMTPAIRFLRDDCIDIPETQVISTRAEITSEQSKAMAHLKATLRLKMGSGEVSAINEAALRGKMLQIVSGAVYDEKHQTHLIDCGPRITALKDIIDASSRKILVFTHLTSVVNLLHRTLKDDYECAVVTGDVSLRDRSIIFGRFQGDDSLRIIIADPRTMAHGLTLTAADTIIWYSPVDSGDIYTQANGRITRPGQTAKSLVYQVWCDPVEKEIYRRLESKEALQGLVMRWIDS